jgi:NAD(P)-dependent dehydrogenase (short-subunit alcohol dehydrogenase family)
MSSRLERKVGLVTGAVGGMGAAHVRRLAEEGACVVAADVRDEEGSSLAGALAERGLRVEYVHVDVRNPDDWVSAVRVAEDRFGSLDILVNNAGILGQQGGFLECDDHDQVFAINQTGPFLGMQAAIPAMLRAGGGAIVNIASVAASVPAGSAAYCASKAAVRMMTMSIAREFGSRGIRANVVSPGLVRTPMTSDIDEADSEQIVRKIPLGRWGVPQDIADAVVFLASDEAAYVSGAELVVDGGRVGQLLD